MRLHFGFLAFNPETKNWPQYDFCKLLCSNTLTPSLYLIGNLKLHYCIWNFRKSLYSREKKNLNISWVEHTFSFVLALVLWFSLFVVCFLNKKKRDRDEKTFYFTLFHVSKTKPKTQLFSSVKTKSFFSLGNLKRNSDTFWRGQIQLANNLFPLLCFFSSSLR